MSSQEVWNISKTGMNLKLFNGNTVVDEIEIVVLGDANCDGKITVDDGKCNFCGRCVKSCPTDAWETIHGYIVSFGGLFGNSINKGEAIIPFIEDKEKLLKICDAAIEFFDKNANPGERFRFTIDRVGREKFEKTSLEAYNG